MITLIYDFETSGLNPYHEDVTEIGCKCLETKDSFTCLVQPLSDKMLSDENQAITGITNKMLKKDTIDRKEIEQLLPHRAPMLLIDKLTKIIHLKSATAIMNVKKDGFYVQGHFPGQPVMPGVLIVEAFGQAAAALTACGIDPKEYDNKLVYLMSVEKAKFRNPVLPDCELHLEIEAIRSHGRVWKYKGTAKVEGKRMADAEWSATIVDRK